MIKKIKALIFDYMSYVPSFASAALTYYLIVLIIPATTLIALGTTLFALDTNTLKSILIEYVTPQFASMIINVFSSTKFTLSSLFIIVLSIYAVSRGVGNIYSISKKMFPTHYKRNESIIRYYIYSIKITIIIIISCLLFIYLFALGPISDAFDIFYGYIILRYVVLFIMTMLFFTLLYKMIPDAFIKFKEAFSGSFITTIGLVILYIILSIYLKHASFSNVYGPLASIVMILFILDWGCKIFYFGMYYTHLKYMKRYNGMIQKVTVERINHKGLGIVKVFNKPCYLNNVMPGEIVEIIVEKEKRNEVIAKVSQILEPSLSRDNPICMQADFCNNCKYQYMNYFNQLTHKRLEIINALSKFTTYKNADDIVLNVIGSNQITGYKQFVHYNLYEYEGELHIGDKGEVCNFLNKCIMNDNKITDILNKLLIVFNTNINNIHIQSLIVKNIDNHIVVILFTKYLNENIINDIKELNCIDTLYIGEYHKNKYYKYIYKVYGDDYYNYTYQGNIYSIHSNSYLFVNKEMEDQYIQLMKDIINPSDKILSLYCQLGLLELQLSNDIVGVDDRIYNIESLIKNVKTYHLKQKYIYGKVSAKVSKIIQEDRFDTIILRLFDKPFSAIFAQNFYHSYAKNIFIVSDNPSMFVRDLFANDKTGFQERYALHKVYSFDSEPYSIKVLAIYHFVLKG